VYDQLARVIRLEQLIAGIRRDLSVLRNQNGIVAAALSGGSLRTSEDGVATGVPGTPCPGSIPFTLYLRFTLFFPAPTPFLVTLNYDAPTGQWVGGILLPSGGGTGIVNSCSTGGTGSQTAYIFQLNPADYSVDVYSQRCTSGTFAGNNLNNTLPGSFTGSSFWGTGQVHQHIAPPSVGHSCSPLVISFNFSTGVTVPTTIKDV